MVEEILVVVQATVPVRVRARARETLLWESSDALPWTRAYGDPDALPVAVKRLLEGAERLMEDVLWIQVMVRAGRDARAGFYIEARKAGPTVRYLAYQQVTGRRWPFDSREEVLSFMEANARAWAREAALSLPGALLPEGEAI